jgi:hypothetical protein
MENNANKEQTASVTSFFLPHDFILYQKIVWNVENVKEFLEHEKVSFKKCFKGVTPAEMERFPKVGEKLTLNLCNHKAIEM